MLTRGFRESEGMAELEFADEVDGDEDGQERVRRRFPTLTIAYR